MNMPGMVAHIKAPEQQVKSEYSWDAARHVAANKHLVSDGEGLDTMCSKVCSGASF